MKKQLLADKVLGSIIRRRMLKDAKGEMEDSDRVKQLTRLPWFDFHEHEGVSFVFVLEDVSTSPEGYMEINVSGLRYFLHIRPPFRNCLLAYSQAHGIRSTSSLELVGTTGCVSWAPSPGKQYGYRYKIVFSKGS